MGDKKKCTNHPDREAVSHCHTCGLYFCSDCLVEGSEYYYCKSEPCTKAYRRDLSEEEILDDDEDRQVFEADRDWIDKSFMWLLGRFGSEALLSSGPVLPTEGFLPGDYDRSEEAVDGLVRQVCGYMKIDPDRIDLVFYEGQDPGVTFVPVYQSDHQGAAGVYLHPESKDMVVIGVDMTLMKDPEVLVAVIAHELAHVHLLADGPLTGEEEDHEHLTDLLTVFYGLGVFGANACVKFSNWEAAGYSGWSASRMGYLSEEMYAYALAVFCWIRGEQEPEWWRHLSHNVRHYIKRDLDDLACTRVPPFLT